MARKLVTLDAGTIEKSQNIGDGELSKGLRVAVKAFELLPKSGDATNGGKNGRK